MIRTGYLRHEIEASIENVPGDSHSRQVRFYARPTFRRACIKYNQLSAAQQKFLAGGTYVGVENAATETSYKYLNIQDIGPHYWKYSVSDQQMVRYWLDKLSREANTFAHSVVRYACGIPELVVNNKAVFNNYVRMVTTETIKVINGVSAPKPTNDVELLEIDASQKGGNIPELVAAELVKDVFDEKHFKEFATKNQVTIKNGKTYRIPRKTHGLIEVWNEKGEPECSLCIVFKDPGLPPSDEVVMKYLLVQHDIDMLWRIANKFHQKPNPL